MSNGWRGSSNFRKERILELIKALNDEKAHESVISALSQIGKPVIPYLKELMKSSNPIERITAIRILGRIGEESISDLILALEDENQWAQLTAVRYLGKLGPKAKGALSHLSVILDNPDSLAFEKAIWAIGEICEGLSEVPFDIPHKLLEILNDEDISDLYFYSDIIRAFGKMKSYPMGLTQIILQRLNCYNYDISTDEEVRILILIAKSDPSSLKLINDFYVTADRYTKITLKMVLSEFTEQNE